MCKEGTAFPVFHNLKKCLIACRYAGKQKTLHDRGVTLYDACCGILRLAEHSFIMNNTIISQRNHFDFTIGFRSDSAVQWTRPVRVIV